MSAVGAAEKGQQRRTVERDKEKVQRKWWPSNVAFAHQEEQGDKKSTVPKSRLNFLMSRESEVVFTAVFSS